MQHELLSCTDGLFPEQRLLLCHFPRDAHKHTSLCNVVRTNEASPGPRRIRLENYRLEVASFIPRRDKSEMEEQAQRPLSRNRHPLGFHPPHIEW